MQMLRHRDTPAPEMEIRYGRFIILCVTDQTGLETSAHLAVRKDTRQSHFL